MLQKKKMAPQNTAAWPEDQVRRQRSRTQGRQHDQDTEPHEPRTRDRQHSARTTQTQGRDNAQGTESHSPRTRDRQHSARTAQTQGRDNSQGTESHPPRTRDRQHSTRGGQTRGGQHEEGTESHTPRNRNRDHDRQSSTRASTQTSRQQQQQPTSAGDEKVRGTSSKMTRRPPSSHSQASQKPTSAPALSLKTRAAQLTVLSSTNLDALLQTRSTPMAGTPCSAYTNLAEHLLREREHRTGDYSRYLPHHLGVRKNASCPPVLGTAHLALARQRDVALEQRDLALRIIDGLAQPRRQVSA